MLANSNIDVNLFQSYFKFAKVHLLKIMFSRIWLLKRMVSIMKSDINTSMKLIDLVLIDYVLQQMSYQMKFERYLES